MSRRSTHWAQINEISFVSGMRLLFRIYRILGRWPFRLVLYPVIAWYVLTRSVARRASVLPPSSRPTPRVRPASTPSVTQSHVIGLR